MANIGPLTAAQAITQSLVVISASHPAMRSPYQRREGSLGSAWTLNGLLFVDLTASDPVTLAASRF